MWRCSSTQSSSAGLVFRVCKHPAVLALALALCRSAALTAPACRLPAAALALAPAGAFAPTLAEFRVLGHVERRQTSDRRHKQAKEREKEEEGQGAGAAGNSKAVHALAQL